MAKIQSSEQPRQEFHERKNRAAARRRSTGSIGDVALKKVRIKEKLEKLQSEMAKLAAIEKLVLASPDQQISPDGCGRAGKPGSSEGPKRAPACWVNRNNSQIVSFCGSK
jgi:hypothetical protein